MLVTEKLTLDDVAVINDVLMTKAENERRAHEHARTEAKRNS